VSFVPLLAFAIALVIAVLLSQLASRTVLSTAVLFLIAGFVAGANVTGIVPLAPDDPILLQFVELALVAVLFTDGMRVTVGALRADWRLPGRALLVGMPLTLAITTLLAHTVVDLPWSQALLVAAALSPTDPVFASALVGHQAVPQRVQHLLNVESGLNDGLALPIVVMLLATAGEQGETIGRALVEAAGGAGLGWALAFSVARLERLSVFGTSEQYRSVAGFAIGLLVFSTAKTLGLNEFLAAFVAGVTVTACAQPVAEAFDPVGHVIAEVLKLAALLLFGALLSSGTVGRFTAADWLFGAAALLLARPLAFAPSLAMSDLSWRERVAVAWFGPKGFASVFFGVLILGSGIADANHLFRVVALVVTASIVAHSSTDVPVARWLGRRGADRTDGGVLPWSSRTR
jgi:NhaP-type Na+/H+ or K+/H+ antiporter